MFQIKPLLLAVVALMVAPNAFAFGIEPRIVGGRDAVRGQFPYYVFLEIETPAQQVICGGSLIARRWILTAAHCVVGATSVQVYLGSLKAWAWDYDEPGRQVINVTKTNDIIMHPNYDATMSHNDIALIKLTWPVEYTRLIKPIPLVCSSTTDMDVIAIGNGFQGYQNHAPILQYTELKTLDMSVCAEEFSARVMATRSNVICVNGDKENLRSACKGDSGGPLVKAKGDALVGIASFISVKGCQEGRPQVFTSVSGHREWIKQHTGVECTK